MPLVFNCLVEWLLVKSHSHPAIALLGDDQVVNPVGWLVDTCDDALLLKVTECLLQVVVPGVRDLPAVLILFTDTCKDISVDFKEAIFR